MRFVVNNVPVDYTRNSVFEFKSPFEKNLPFITLKVSKQPRFSIDDLLMFFQDPSQLYDSFQGEEVETTISREKIILIGGGEAILEEKKDKETYEAYQELRFQDGFRELLESYCNFLKVLDYGDKQDFFLLNYAKTQNRSMRDLFKKMENKPKVFFNEPRSEFAFFTGLEDQKKESEVYGFYNPLAANLSPQYFDKKTSLILDYFAERISQDIENVPNYYIDNLVHLGISMRDILLNPNNPMHSAVKGSLN